MNVTHGNDLEMTLPCISWPHRRSRPLVWEPLPSLFMVHMKISLHNINITAALLFLIGLDKLLQLRDVKLGLCKSRSTCRSPISSETDALSLETMTFTEAVCGSSQVSVKQTVRTWHFFQIKLEILMMKDFPLRTGESFLRLELHPQFYLVLL